LAPADRERIRQNYRNFRRLPPDQRIELRRRFRDLSPEQRRGLRDRRLRSADR
jgi:hypothetical protein